MTIFATPDRQITARRVAQMLVHSTPAQIAGILNITEEEVLAMLAKAGRTAPPRFAAVCRRTGRTITAHSERGAFLKAQIAGFAEYDFGPVGEVKA